MSVSSSSSDFRRFDWHDAERQRPVLGSVWTPSSDPPDETADPFPLVVFSHGAFGSALNYSWLAEYLTRNGFVVLGVDHFAESWQYGADTVDPASPSRIWYRPADCTFALTRLLADEHFVGRIDPARIGAVGHSSGGTTALALGGAILDADALSAYCRSDAGQLDLGCHYAPRSSAVTPAPAEAARSYRDSRVGAIVALDPACGPGYDEASLSRVDIPALIVGSTDNDFLPFEYHAGRYASLLPDAQLLKLQRGEGHFVYLDCCTSDRVANGVPLCVDRPGVDREAVHADLAPRILAFLMASLA